MQAACLQLVGNKGRCVYANHILSILLLLLFILDVLCGVHVFLQFMF